MRITFAENCRGAAALFFRNRIMPQLRICFNTDLLARKRKKSNQAGILIGRSITAATSTFETSSFLSLYLLFALFVSLYLFFALFVSFYLLFALFAPFAGKRESGFTGCGFTGCGSS